MKCTLNFSLLISLIWPISYTGANKDAEILIKDFQIIELPPNQRPYSSPSITPPDINPRDSTGVPLFKFQGQMYYHPVRISVFALQYINVYNNTGNLEFLRKAELLANKLEEMADTFNDALFFPYTFDYALHGIETQKMKKPWYSGMAQGQALSLFVRLYGITGKSKYLHIADKIFSSFSRFQGKDKPWISFIDSNKYYWIEEYPREIPTHVLNGFIFALYGVYDYYLLTHNELSLTLLKASLTTIRHYIGDYRVEGKISLYCLLHRISNSKYHNIITEQLTEIYLMCRDPIFKEMAEKFYQDYHDNPKH